MGIEVLWPQDCLIKRIRLPRPALFPRRRNHHGTSYSTAPNLNSNPKPNRKPASRPDRKRSQSEPAVSKRLSSDGVVMEKVTILRRRESLDSKIKNDLVVCRTTERLGPNQKMEPKHTTMVDLRSPIGKCDVLYAGSAFAVSPVPSSLPLPSFSKKKLVMGVVDDSATRDLRRLLQLD